MTFENTIYIFKIPQANYPVSSYFYRNNRRIFNIGKQINHKLYHKAAFIQNLRSFPSYTVLEFIRPTLNSDVNSE